MKRRLFALFLALVTVLQPVLPAAAESLEPEAETTAFVTEEPTEEPTEEVTVEITEKPTEEVTEETTEETSEATEVTEAVTEETGATETLLLEDEASEIEAYAGVSVVLSGSCGDNVAFALTSDGVMTISGSGEMNGYVTKNNKTTAPWSDYISKITQVVIKGNVENIGTCAFAGCSAITDLNLDNAEKLRTIGQSSFEDCAALKKLALPETIISIGTDAFYHCTALTSVVMDSNPSNNSECEIRARAFAGCTSLKEVVFADNVTVISNFAFQRCTSLKSITLPKGLKELCSAFYQCTSLTTVIMEENSNPNYSCKLSAGVGAAFSDCTSLKNVQLSRNVTEIRFGCFYGCTSLQTIELPEKLTYLGGNAFVQVPITEVTIPASLVTCEKSVNDTDGSVNSPFRSCDSLTSATIAQGTTAIPANLFYNANSLQYVNIPNTVTSIGENAFFGCMSLEAIYIPASVKKIDASFFPSGVSKVYYGGTKAQWASVSVNAVNALPTPEFSHVHSYTKEVTDAYGKSIYVCDCGSYTHSEPILKPANTITASNISLYTDSTKAQTVSLNASALGGAALSYRSDNTSVTVSASGTVTVAKGFSGTANITITAGATADYKKTTKTVTVTVKSATDSIAASGSYGTLRWELTESGTFTLSGNGSMAYSASGYPWKRYVTSDIRRISIGDGVTSIAKDAFWGCEALENLALGSKVQTIGEHAFFSSALTQVVLPASVRSISYSAFSSPTLESIYVDSSNTTYCDINGVLFTKNKETLVLFPEGRIGTYIVPSTTRKLAQSAFSGTQLAEIQISEGVTDIGQACFAGGQISKVTLPGTLRTIGKNAFFSCAELKAIDIPGSVETIGASAFDETGLKEVTIGNGVTSIGEEAFLSCPMTTVTLPESVTSIGAHAIGYVYQARDYQRIEGFIIRGVPGSTAHQYATNNSLAFASSTGPIANIITASDIHVYVDDSKAQTVALNASALGGATLSYRSDNTSVTVSANGTVTVAKGFAGTANITITAAATDAYQETRKTITVTVTQKVETSAEITLPSQKALAGKDLTVPVQLTKNSGIAGFGLTVNYDENILTLNSITVGSAISGNGTFSTNGSITTWYTVENTTATGELMKLNFTVKEDAAEGDTEVTVALTDGLDSNLSDEDGNPVSVTITAGKITVTRGILGDVNGDGSVAIADVVLLNRSVLGKVTLADTAKKLGDVNGDGNISIADVVKLNRYVLKKIAALAAPAESNLNSVVRSQAAHAAISVGTVDGAAGQTVTVPVRISGNPGIAGYSLKVNYDTSVLTLNAMTAGSLISGNGTFSVNDEAHIVNWYTVDNLTGDGELLNLSFTVKEGAAEGIIPVSVSLNDDLDSNLSDEDGMAVPATFVSGGIRIAKAQSGTFENLTWKLDDEGTLTISGSGEMGHASSYPWEAYQGTVRKLIVKTGVTGIARSAFSSFEALEEVVLADTVTTIDGSAFSMCSKLNKLDLGSGLRVIYSHAFEFCDSLEEVNLPASASSISPSAFENCGNLQSFHVASGNETYCDADGVLFWTDKVLLASFPGGRTGSYTVPSSVKTIGDCAFYASKLTEVVLPSGLKTIGDECFRYSTVSQLTLPAGLVNLGVGAFEGCTKLKTITIPGSVKTVSDSAFWGSGLKSVTLEDGITTIGKEAFLSCGLTKVNIPSSVTSIGEHALGYEANRMDYDKVAGFTIFGVPGSAAQRYADSNGFLFKGSSTITYDANGGTGAPAPTEKNRGSTAYLSSTRPAKVGYQFTGWAESPDAATAQYQPGGSYTKDEDITLYAVWKANTYSIRFYANDGTQASVTQNSLKYDAAYTLRANTFQRTGYVFLGWAKTANGQVIYTDQAEIQNLTQTNNATVALYAQWQANRYQVRFDLNGGSGTVNPISAEYGKTYSLPSAAPARAGYTLSGWNTKADGKGTGYALDAQISNLTAEDGGSVTLYAVWKANTYSIRYYANDGTQSSVIQTDLNYGAQYALRANSFTWKGRVFLGWAETADGAVQYTNSEKVQNLTAENGAVVKLYAQWRLVTYQVRFDANGGVGTLQGIRVTYGDAFRLPEADALTRELYSFSGWTAVIGGVTKTYQPGTELRDVTAQDGEVITFKAVWTPNFGTIGTVEWVLDSGVLTISGTGRVPDYSSAQATPWAKAQVSSVQIGEGITYVGSCAFSGCVSLTAVSLPASLQGIGANAFRDCGSSLRYTYAGTLAQWGDISFAAADDPTASGVVLYESGKYMNGTCGDAMWKLQSDGTLRISGTGAAKAPTAGTGWAAEDVQSLVVEEGITEIGGSLFRGCGAMKTAALPRSLQTVGANAFSGCNALTTVRYSGKQEQWDAVSVGSGNEALTGARLLLSTYLITYVNVEGAQNPNPDVADKDKALTLKDASKTGYTFGGWYREASFQTRVPSIPAGNEEDVTLYAKWTPIRYTVNFNANGGDGSPSQASVSYDEALTLPGGSFSRTGYVLTGWNTAQDGTGTAYESSQEVVNLLSVQGASETLYAQWRPITYRVEFDLRGGEGQIDAITVQYDESFTVPTKDSVHRIGYTFDSWFTDNLGGPYKPGHNAKNLTTVDGAVVTLHPYWDANWYFVEFRAMNGTGQCVSQGGFNYDEPRQLNFNTFQWKGYTFVGWAVTPQGPVKYADGETVVNLTEENMRTVPLFARWVPTTYYLNLDANGGTGAPEKVTMHYGTSYTLPTEQDVRRPGYMLTGWKGKIGKSTKTYKPGAELRDLTTVEGEEFTLTAQWGPLKYTVRFEPGEGTGKIKTQAMTYGKLTALASNGFKRPGYVFAGWRGEDGTLYDDKEKVSDLTPEPNGVVVLTAQWKPNAYQLVFDPNGGTGELPGSGGLYTCGVTYRIPDSQPVRTGYRFLGWSTKAKGDVMYESGGSIRDLATVNGKTVTLYAVWAPKQYTLLFDANGGSISVNPMFGQTCGKAVTLPSGSFTRPGYVFTGWNTKADGTGTAYKNKEKVTFCTDAAAVFLYAQWQEIHYTVTYKNVALGSEGGNPTSYTMAEGLQLKDGFTRGMTFEGWYLDAKFNTPFDGFKPGDKNARNVTVYAKWSGYSDIFFVYYYKNAGYAYDYVADGHGKWLYYSQTYTLRANSFKRPGYRFLGWSRDPKAKVPEYTDKQKVGNLQPDIGSTTDRISLYAVWEPIQYTITYRGVTQEEIRNLGNPETFTAADKISLKKPSRPGYRFEGWYTTAKFKGSSDTIDGSKSLKNLTLYAKWTNGNTKYTVAFNGNGAASGKNSVKALSFGQDLKLTNMSFKRTGYQFLGWSTDPKAKEPMYLVGQTVHDLTDKAETVTLYAVWEAISYTVTLKNVTGANVPGVVEDTLTYTADGLTLPIPSREGAVFEGWYTTANFKSGTSVKRLLPGATGDLTLYAKWRIQ